MRSVRSNADAGPAFAEQKDTATSPEIARSAANTEASRDAGCGRLADFLKEEFSADTAKRVLGYFGIIDSLEAETDPASRQERLASLVGRMQRMSEAADDGRPIEASIIIPVFNSVAFTIATRGLFSESSQVKSRPRRRATPIVSKNCGEMNSLRTGVPACPGLPARRTGSSGSAILKYTGKYIERATRSMPGSAISRRTSAG